jgi:hypothetical protein
VAEDTVALDNYLLQLVQRKEVLPPGFLPDDTPGPSARNKRPRPTDAAAEHSKSVRFA